MSNILYELHLKFEPAMVMPFVMFAFVFFLPGLGEKVAKAKGEEYTENRRIAVRIVCIAAGCFSVLVGVIAVAGQMHMYHTVSTAYYEGNYQVVEGYVEEYKEQKYESFRIKDVCFEYSDYNIQAGYHNTKSHGGVITGDGQYLKIGYIYYNSSYGNIIVYIEEPK